MAPDALAPNDPQVQHKFIRIKGTDITYYYVLAEPKGKPRATVLLFHGFPDLGIGWKYQVPYLLSLNFRVIIPDMLGYGQTSAPNHPQEYSFKKMCDQMAFLIHELVPEQKVILGGHDWGAFMAWRMAMWYPELLYCVFCLAVNFTPPNRTYVSLEEVAKRVPTLKYHQQFAGLELETLLQDPEQLRGFLNTSYKSAAQVVATRNAQSQGVPMDALKNAPQTPLMPKAMMDHYVEEYMRHSIHGPLNWYRTRKYNFEDELEFAQKPTIHKFEIPVMCIMAKHDVALPPEMAHKQRRHFEGLFVQDVFDCSHWIMLEKPDETNKAISDFVECVFVDSSSTSKL
jgi:soluble epoxide hydrolase/lipid-phosphate phosphatase